MAQAVEQSTLSFGSVHDFSVMRWSPMMGSPISEESAWRFPPTAPPLTRVLSFPLK